MWSRLFSELQLETYRWLSGADCMHLQYALSLPSEWLQVARNIRLQLRVTIFQKLCLDCLKRYFQLADLATLRRVQPFISELDVYRLCLPFPEQIHWTWLEIARVTPMMGWEIIRHPADFPWFANDARGLSMSLAIKETIPHIPPSIGQLEVRSITPLRDEAPFWIAGPSDVWPSVRRLTIYNHTGNDCSLTLASFPNTERCLFSDIRNLGVTDWHMARNLVHIAINGYTNCPEVFLPTLRILHLYVSTPGWIAFACCSEQADTLTELLIQNYSDPPPATCRPLSQLRVFGFGGNDLPRERLGQWMQYLPQVDVMHLHFVAIPGSWPRSLRWIVFYQEVDADLFRPLYRAGIRIGVGRTTMHTRKPWRLWWWDCDTVQELLANGDLVWTRAAPCPPQFL